MQQPNEQVEPRIANMEIGESSHDALGFTVKTPVASVIRILGGGPQDLKSWNGSNKICKIRMPEKRENTNKIKPQRNLFY